MSKEFNMRTDLLDDPDLEEIAHLIKEGNTSGHLNNGEGKNICWELKVSVWKD